MDLQGYRRGMRERSAGDIRRQRHLPLSAARGVSRLVGREVAGATQQLDRRGPPDVAEAGGDRGRPCPTRCGALPSSGMTRSMSYEVGADGQAPGDAQGGDLPLRIETADALEAAISIAADDEVAVVGVDPSVDAGMKARRPVEDIDARGEAEVEDAEPVDADRPAADLRPLRPRRSRRARGSMGWSCMSRCR